MKNAILLLVVLLGGCALSHRQVEAPETPAEAARHNAALASVVVQNATTSPLTIAFRNATSPVHEVVIGRAAPGEQARQAPVPAGEPIILIARKADGTEYRLDAKTFAIDAEWVWQIPREATFVAPTWAK